MTDYKLVPKDLPPFAIKIIEKLRRFNECAEDGQGADIGRHWFDILTRLGLLNRVQRSPATWEMSQQGEDALAAAPDVQGEPEESAQQTLDQISDLFRIGKCARTPAAILANVQNAHRFAGMLHAVEREFFMIDGEPDEDFPDDEPQPECLLNCYGSTAEQYVEQFRRALEIIRPAPQPVERQPFDYTDAYRGARDDLAIWKRRALEAESRVREQDKIIDRMGEDLDSINSPTFMGEPVLPERQPAPDVSGLVEALVEARRELNACQRVIHYAGGFDSAYVDGAQAALQRIDAALAAYRKGGDA